MDIFTHIMGQAKLEQKWAALFYTKNKLRFILHYSEICYNVCRYNYVSNKNKQCMRSKYV